MLVDKFRLIEEVQRRPLLWDLTNTALKRSVDRCNELWTEIGGILHVDAITCKRTWKKLRLQFCNEAHRIPRRIAKAKETGEYNPHKKYYSWIFFDALRFVAEGRSYRATFDLNFEHDSDSDIEVIENNNSNSTIIEMESDDDIEIIESDNLDQMETGMQKFFENSYESDNDVEIVENDNYQTQDQEENSFQNSSLHIETDNTIPVYNSFESNAAVTMFKPYRVSLTSCVQDTVCSKDHIVLLNDGEVFKEEPEIQIEADPHLLENDTQEDASATVSAAELSDSYENSNLLVESNVNERNVLSTNPEDCPPNSNDEDYSFLYSFLSPTKSMTQLQKMEFRLNMKNLLVKIFPASASVNILEKQLLLPDDSDPDKKFLISFWPFIKSMSLIQNLQFRAKLSDLVLQILANEKTS